MQLLNTTAKALMDNQVKAEGKADCFELMHAHEGDSPLQQMMANGRQRTAVYEYTGKDGTTKHLEMVASPLLDGKGEVIAVIDIGRDITAHLQIQEELRQQKDSFEHSAHYDSLTNLPNRALFADRLSQSLSKAKRLKEGLALLFVDLDHFKPINDTLGHDVGDQVLKQISERLTSCVREMDTVARLGGDEFTVILESIRQPQGAALIAHKINQAVQKPIYVEEQEFYLSASIGISLYPENGTTIDELVKAADTAMYRVKQEGRDSFQFYAENITGLAFERALMESQLRNALSDNEFCVFYQPQLSMDSSTVVGLEAFVRWEHAQLGTIMPGKFIPFGRGCRLDPVH